MAKSKPGGSKTTSTGKTASQPPRKAEAPKPARGGIAKPVTPSPELGAIVGTEPLSRAELTKRIWDYIKKHQLQDAQDRRQINADIFVERLWRSIKYEEVYLKHYETLREAREGLTAYFRFYNTERPHQSLGNQTPAEVYEAAGVPIPTAA